MPKVIYVIDDDASFRTSARQSLELAGYEVRAYSSAHQFLELYTEQHEPGCILLDPALPRLDGLDLQLGSSLPVICITGIANVRAAIEAIKSGADDLLIKPVNFDDLLSAVKKALLQDKNLRDQFDEFRARIATLTPREKKVFELVVRGKVGKQIAHELQSTERTIKAHREHMMHKMGATSIVELISKAARAGALRD
jgi:FixJ family two-component response regulator